MAFELTSPSFAHGGEIPSRHTCEGPDLSPELRWSGAPAATKSFALIVDDPDARRERPFVHWLLYKIPHGHRSIPAGSTGTGIEGRNDFGRTGYGGPQPPPGHGVHRYRFRLYALDREIGLAPGATREELEAQMRGHVLEEGELVGTYEREARASAG